MRSVDQIKEDRKSFVESVIDEALYRFFVENGGNGGKPLHFSLHNLPGLTETELYWIRAELKYVGYEVKDTAGFLIISME